jgi:MinD superfamily P-loop ATPase
MIVTIASGKGGTGKTTVSASLAAVWDAPLVAVDLDVEEPNLHLFLAPELDGSEDAALEVPVVDAARCTRCGACAALCQFKAISLMGDTVLTFPEMCHGCGGCMAVCPEGAVGTGRRVLGEVAWGRARGARFLMGRLRVGEAMSPPLMRRVKARLGAMLAQEGADAVVDAPPGVSCPAVSAVMDSDFAVLVTEPTPFGLHDLRLAAEAFGALGGPLGVVINRAGVGDGAVRDFCLAQGLPVLAEIPFDRAVAEGYARGRVVADLGPEQRATFSALRDAIRARCANAPKEAAHA